MGTLPSSRRGKCVTLFGGVRDTPKNSSACKQQQGLYTNYCCNPYGKAAPITWECLTPPKKGDAFPTPGRRQCTHKYIMVWDVFGNFPRFGPKFEGPYRVIERFSNVNYRVQHVEQLRKRFNTHVNRMIPFIKRFSYLHLKNLDDLQPDETEVKGIVPSPRRGKCVTLFGGVRDTPKNSSACKQQQGLYTNYCCNPYGRRPPLNYAARGEESLRQGVTNKQKFQSTTVLSYTGWRAGEGDTTKRGALSPRFRNEWTKHFQHH
ncbi:hypothetical protein TNCV_481 [Trichonephila clavipes]|nr:hypothetical protein TNCV_481 [Trichonephila clavipes]